ncbi:sialate O-acetylesterase [Danxiaibacter flavus]|uniref:Sialate O-acetylesterase n=1 Tax=Danxiaibacter flavus TaxID=3049108 RepID=A0ABV3ZKK4_9BACT|nr:sialate O-acetylesterase [Chitinophagaceae bacterium DXS]
MIHSFLMIGQSNMAGRGFKKDVPLIFNEGIKMLRNGRWQIMSEPINYDRPTAGIGLASSFAAAWRLKNETEEIGLIPCADGGTSLEDWAVGGALFDHAVAEARLAQRTSKLAGILWHQGETDCFPDRAAVYGEKFNAIITELRHQLSVPDIPLIVGGLGDFLTEGLYGQYFDSYPIVNEALVQFAQTHENCYFVTAEELTANEDYIHFNAASLRIFGVRYFEAFNKLQHVMKPFAHEDEVLQAIYNRPLTRKEKNTLLEYRFASGEITLQEFQEKAANS